MLRLFARPPQTVRRSELAVHLPDGRELVVVCVRHPQARRLKLSVDERGARLTLPPRTGERPAIAFLHEHRGWLQAQLDALAQDDAPVLQVGTSRVLPLRGTGIALTWAPARSTRVTELPEGLRFDVRGLSAGMAATPAIHRALHDFYEAQARADVARWLPRYRDALPRQPARIVFKRMATQWGSLSPAGVVALDLALVLARPAAFEYVLVHELCHLLHHDHSARFWGEVSARLPHWREQRTYLHAHGRSLKARMRAYVG